MLQSSNDSNSNCSSRRKMRVPLMSVTSFFNRLQMSGVVVIDCRSFNEFTNGHVHGAFNCSYVKGWRQLNLDTIIYRTKNQPLIEKLKERDLMEIIVVSGNRSTNSFFYKRDWGYKFAQLLVQEARVCSVKFVVQNFDLFIHKYPFMIQTHSSHYTNSHCSSIDSDSSTDSDIATTTTTLSTTTTTTTTTTTRNPKTGEVTVQFPNEIVDDFLYLGNFWQANSMKILQQLGITHVLNMGAITKNRNQFEKIQYLNIVIPDKVEVDIRKDFHLCVDFIKQAAKVRGKILIHCVQGISRSSTIVIWYLMLTTKCTLSAAYAFVQRKRPLIFPNRGFMAQLIEMEKELYGIESVDLEELNLLQNGLLPSIDRKGSHLRDSFV
jgi:protein-tyrosine phosphatase/rhodanese-related sulfurtransferase